MKIPKYGNSCSVVYLDTHICVQCVYICMHVVIVYVCLCMCLYVFLCVAHSGSCEATHNFEEQPMFY